MLGSWEVQEDPLLALRGIQPKRRAAAEVAERAPQGPVFHHPAAFNEPAGLHCIVGVFSFSVSSPAGFLLGLLLSLDALTQAC